MADGEISEASKRHGQNPLNFSSRLKTPKSNLILEESAEQLREGGHLSG